MQDIYFGFNLQDIINGKYDIQSLIVENGIFNIVIHKDNATNVENALSKNSAKESSKTSIQFKKIRFTNLDIHTLDEATNTDIENFIYEAQGGFTLKDSLIAGHIDTDFELNVIKNGDTTFIRKKHFELHTNVEFDNYTGILDIQPSGIIMENGDFELEGSMIPKKILNLIF